MIDFKKILKTSSFIDLIITFNLIVSIIGFVLVCFVFIVNMILDDFSKSNEEIEQITIEDVEIPPEYDARVEEIMNNMKDNSSTLKPELFADIIRDYVFSYQNKIDYLINKLNPEMKKEYLDNYRVRVDDYVSKAMIYTISDLSVFSDNQNGDTFNKRDSSGNFCIECIQECIDELKKQERELSKLVKEQGSLN